MMPRIALNLCASLIVLCGLPSDLLAQQKTVRECRAEWQARRAEYQASGYKDYGNTKRGAYMCERDATQQGFRAAKNEKHPS
jgi:hypothetical protein